MRVIKDYLSITNRVYRLICNIIVPLVLGLAACIAGICIAADSIEYMVVIVAAVTLTMAEIIEDYWGFGNICQDGCLGMEYLKTSIRGRDMLENTFLADALVRPVRIAICMFIASVPYIINTHDGLFVIFALLVISDMSVWVINITRHIDLFQGVAIISVIFSGVAAALLVWFMFTEWSTTAMCIILVILLILGVAFTRWHMTRKIEKSYIDEK